MSKGQYVCQRAAHAIIAEIGQFRVSGDALGAINMFIDEFLFLLITSSLSLDLVELKAAVIHLLPHSLGKNALVEAEIELKQQVEQEQGQHDFTSYEKMRILSRAEFPPLVDQISALLQLACASYCTLSTSGDNSTRSLPTNNALNTNIVIPPVVVIYVTAIVEHLAEYLLNSVAMTADQADTEHIRVKEVLVTLLDDPQVNILFQRMNLKEKLEKRVLTYPTMNTSTTYYNNTSLPTPSPSPVSTTRRDQQPLLSRNSHTSTTSSTHNNQRDNCNNNNSNPDNISFNEFLEDDTDEPRVITPSSISSIRSSESINDRPLSVMSNGTVKSSGSKSRFNFFGKKDKRTSISLNFSNNNSSSKRSAPSSTMTSPTALSFQSVTSPTSMSSDFDDLIRSGKTKKVTLTPNRLKSIEVKEDTTNNEVAPWEKPASSPATATGKVSRSKKRSMIPTDTTPPPPLPPLPRLHRDSHSNELLPVSPQTDNNSPPLTPASSVASRPSQRSRHSIIYEERSSTKSSLKSSCSTQEDLTMIAAGTEYSTSLKRNPSKLSTSSSLYSNASHNKRNLMQQQEEAAAVKPRFERPSSMVVKRASMGSRPPSFHENVLNDVNGNMLIAAAAAASVTTTGISYVDTNNKTFDNLRQEYERKKCLTSSTSSGMIKKMSCLELNNEESMVSTSEPNMIYVVPPSSIPSRPSTANGVVNGSSIIKANKARTMDRGCQTDPIALHTLIHQHHIQQQHQDDKEEEQSAEEEWFIEEEEWEDHNEEEKFVVEWLLGNA